LTAIVDTVSLPSKGATLPRFRAKSHPECGPGGHAHHDDWHPSPLPPWAHDSSDHLTRVRRLSSKNSDGLQPVKVADRLVFPLICDCGRGPMPDHYDVWIDEIAIDKARIGCSL
jgi:hypothetical protein